LSKKRTTKQRNYPLIRLGAAQSEVIPAATIQEPHRLRWIQARARDSPMLAACAWASPPASHRTTPERRLPPPAGTLAQPGVGPECDGGCSRRGARHHIDQGRKAAFFPGKTKPRMRQESQADTQREVDEMKSSCALFSLPLARSTRSPRWKRLGWREETQTTSSGRGRGRFFCSSPPFTGVLCYGIVIASQSPLNTFLSWKYIFLQFNLVLIKSNTFLKHYTFVLLFSKGAYSMYREHMCLSFSAPFPHSSLTLTDHDRVIERQALIAQPERNGEAKWARRRSRWRPDAGWVSFTQGMWRRNTLGRWGGFR
jgi:hypothetical protein